MDGSASTKTAYIHYGGSSDNSIRFGRYGDNFGSWEANVVHIDMDAPTNTFRIQESGNIGIGTNSPSKKLDVAGDINFTGNLYKNGSLFSGGL